MKSQFEGLSNYLYEALFKSKFDKKEWKIGVAKKEMDGTEHEEFYIGARYDELFWNQQKKLRKKHFFIRITKDVASRQEYDITIENNISFPYERIIEKITQYVTDVLQLDTVLNFYTDRYFLEQKATGEKAKGLFDLMNAFTSNKYAFSVKPTANEFQLQWTSNVFTLVRYVEEGVVRLFVSTTEVKAFSTIEEVVEWLETQHAEIEKIADIKKQVIQVIKEKTKIEEVEIFPSNYKMQVGSTRVDCSIIRKFHLGKVKVYLSFGDEKGNVVFQNAEKKAIELATKFANNYRLKHLTGQSM